MNERDQLIEEANSLGLEFQKNIKTVKLAELVEKTKSPKIEEEKAPVTDKIVTKRQRIADAKKEAFTTDIVSITNLDKRDNDKVSVAVLSFENMHFGISRKVPLDTPIELERGLIKAAKEINITVHQAEIKKGELTGASAYRLTPKYSITYVKDLV